MSLGEFFPENIKKGSATRNVVPGAVIKMFVIMDDGKEHEKRFLVVHVDENTVACVINTKINSLITNRPSLLKCQVAIEPVGHPFMHHESHIDCSKVRKYPTADVVDGLTSKPEWVLGTINARLRDQVVAAIKCAPQLPPIDAGIYAASLESVRLL